MALGPAVRKPGSCPGTVNSFVKLVHPVSLSLWASLLIDLMRGQTGFAQGWPEASLSIVLHFGLTLRSQGSVPGIQ